METIIWKIVTPELCHYHTIEFNPQSIRSLTRSADLKRPKKKKWKALKLDCVFVNYLVKELHFSAFYRLKVVQTTLLHQGPDVLILIPTSKDLIDYNWNERLYRMVKERCEVDHAFSWLSTLGGAFSALGDYFENCAETAGKISIQQLQLAFRLGDPNMQARCRLYLSLSLIQKKKFKLAMNIIRREYQAVTNQLVVDERLVRMCKGIWAKLQYEHSLYRKEKNIKR